MELTQELVKSLFDYKDGLLYWKPNTSKYRHVRTDIPAGGIGIFKGGNRRRIKIHPKLYLATRVIFLYHKGYLPDVVDHENHNTIDDRIENLRDADRFKNMRNSTSRKGSSSQYLGVIWCNRDNKWIARIWVANEKRNINILRTNIESEAALAYNREAVRYHKEFANLNIIQL